MTDQASRWQKRFEIPVTVAALATIPLLIIEQSHAGPPWQFIASIGDWAAWLVFLAELVVMLAVAPSRRAYLRQHPVDLVVVVFTPPFAPSGIQALRVLRMLRVLRLVRLGPLLRRLFSLQGLEYAALLAAVTLLGGAEAFAATERVSFGTGVYWGIETMTTVGYGDVTPATNVVWPNPDARSTGRRRASRRSRRSRMSPQSPARSRS